MTQMTDPRGKIISYVYGDPSCGGCGGGGHLEMVTDALSNVTEWIYSPTANLRPRDGLLETSIDAAGIETDYTYDDMGRVVTIEHPAGSAITSTTTYPPRRVFDTNSAMWQRRRILAPEGDCPVHRLRVGVWTKPVAETRSRRVAVDALGLSPAVQLRGTVPRMQVCFWTSMAFGGRMRLLDDLPVSFGGTVPFDHMGRTIEVTDAVGDMIMRTCRPLRRRTRTPMTTATTC